MYILSSTTLRRPYEVQESNSTLMAELKALDGTLSRDYFGSNKRVWTLKYTNTNVDDYDNIKAIYDSYVATGSPKTWSITETNYPVSSTSVHLDLIQRAFSVKGYNLLSDFDLVLTEA